MPNQKISELTAIVTVDTSLDVLPIVDTSANTTKKISPTALKTALALDNVNNTSDANKPVSTAQQDALNAKVTGNTAIVAATKTKITYDAKGLVTAGNILDAADMPMAINAANIGTGVVSSTEFGYLDGVTSAIQTQIDSKQATLVSATNIKTINSTSLVGAGDVAVQATLVSGTNIKTINSTSLLGSGDIVISAAASGVAGAIQFSNGSAFASDAANLFWDDTNNRLGVGLNNPTQTADILGNVKIASATSGLLIRDYTAFNTYKAFYKASETPSDSNYLIAMDTDILINSRGSGTDISYNNSLRARFGNATSLLLKGSGSTSATTSLLVQNSAGNQIVKVTDDGIVKIGGNGKFAYLAFGRSADAIDIGDIQVTSSQYFQFSEYGGNGFRFADGYGKFPMFLANGKASVNKNAIADASAQFEVVSTTGGILPPRMTTTQKNAIATPAAGLVVYDNTTNKLCCYNGSTWNDLF